MGDGLQGARAGGEVFDGMPYQLLSEAIANETCTKK